MNNSYKSNRIKHPLKGGSNISQHLVVNRDILTYQFIKYLTTRNYLDNNEHQNTFVFADQDWCLYRFITSQFYKGLQIRKSTDLDFRHNPNIKINGLHKATINGNIKDCVWADEIVSLPNRDNKDGGVLVMYRFKYVSKETYNFTYLKLEKDLQASLDNANINRPSHSRPLSYPNNNGYISYSHTSYDQYIRCGNEVYISPLYTSKFLTEFINNMCQHHKKCYEWSCHPIRSEIAAEIASESARFLPAIAETALELAI